MLGLFIGVLTVIMMLDCIILVLLVLMQLPKKEAGAGLAFGGAATDALFGAGSGNFLTKATKYAAGVFFVLAITLSVLQHQQFGRSDTSFKRDIEERGKQAPGPTPEASVAPAPATISTNPAVQLLPMGALTNSPRN